MLQARRAVRRQADPRLLDPRRERTVLEEDAVRPVTLRYYQDFMQQLETFAVAAGEVLDVSTVDSLAARWMEDRFLQGEQSHLGGKLIAAIKHRWPRFARWGDLKLPRAIQAAKGWKVRSPATSRLPLPWEVIALLASRLLLEGKRRMAFAVVLTFHAYLRPSECLRIRARDIIPPMRGRQHRHWSILLHPAEQQRASKTNEFDESLRIDLDDFQFLQHGLRFLREGLLPDDRICDFTQAQWAAAFRHAARAEELDGLAPHLYQLRHSGPSHDLAAGLRELPLVKHRGRWRADASVRRYTKGGRLTEQLMRLRGPVRARAVAAALQLPALLRLP